MIYLSYHDYLIRLIIILAIFEMFGICFTIHLDTLSFQNYSKDNNVGKYVIKPANPNNVCGRANAAIDAKTCGYEDVWLVRFNLVLVKQKRLCEKFNESLSIFFTQPRSVPSSKMSLGIFTQ